MTEQEVFNKVWDYFVRNKNPPGLSSTKQCAYRGESGTKCAIGVLIPDDKYTPSLELKFPYELKSLGIVPDLSMDFYYSLQYCHDESIMNACGNVPEFHVGIENKLRNMAKKYSLSIEGE